MPIGRQKFVLVQHDLEHAAKLFRIDNRQQHAARLRPGCSHATRHSRVRSRRFSMNHSMRRLKPGRFSTSFGSRVSTANSGIRPTMERIFSGSMLAIAGMCRTS